MWQNVRRNIIFIILKPFLLNITKLWPRKLSPYLEDHPLKCQTDQNTVEIQLYSAGKTSEYIPEQQFSSE